MKAIISHDIDHITVSEHLLRDVIIPKYMARMHVELVLGKISLREYILRWSDFFKNKWQNIDELITFNNVNQVPSSFFVAVSRGVGLNYTNNAALLWIEQMKLRNCEIGIHGIAFDNQQQIRGEYDLFRSLSDQSTCGIRMHYVRNTKETYKMLAACGYVYDSTEYSFNDPYKIDGMWEFPFQIMDGWIIEAGKRWQAVNLKQAREHTLRIIDNAHQGNLKYLGVDFHDRYFSHSYHTWLNWYMWLIEYLKKNKVEFVNYNQAVKELENTGS